MQTHQLIQGSPEWHSYRATHFNASDAPAMLGCSPYTTRAQLMHQMHTGLTTEHDAATERRFADGHRFEALARPLAEEIIGEELAPVVGSDGELSASFDGLTLMGDTAFEHKTLSAELREALGKDKPVSALPKHYRVQMEQQCMVAGCERVLFMASKWDGDTLSEERHCWYYPDAALRAEIIAGWKQFAADLANYKPEPVAVPAPPVGRTPETLPALRIEITGAVTASNLAEFKATALGAIQSVNRTLTTDQHFADAEQAVKWCGEVESRIKAAKEHALSQTASIEALFRTLDDVSAEARRVRLDLEKLVERRKGELKGELVAEAKAAYERHEAQCRQEAGAWILLTPPDFAGSIKGKRNFESMRDALDVTLAKAKIAASEQASKIRGNLAALDEESNDHEHLFRDRMTFINLTPEAVRLMVRQRIAEHQAAEQKRAEELAELERARIRAEEAARLEREQAEREAAERRQQEEAARRQREEQEAVARAAATPQTIPAEPQGGQDEFDNWRQGGSPAPVANVVQMRQPAPTASTPPTLKLGQIGERLGFSLTGEFLKNLGFEPAARDKDELLFRESQFPLICMRLVAHIKHVQAKHAA